MGIAKADSDPALLVDGEPPLDRGRVYRGDLLVFRGLPAMLGLVARARAMAEAAFAPHPPPLAQASFGPEDFLARAAALRRSFMHDAEARAAFRAVIESLGLDAAATYADRLILRLQPSGDTHSGRRVRDLPPHRDTWGSNLMSQVNLWGPVFPLDPGATMVIWPTLFDRPLRNTSADWDLERLREAPGRYPLLPVLRGPVPNDGGDAPELPVLIAPGDLLCFSGAHLHASRPNRSGRVRVSVDSRTVDLADLQAGRGAENVDGRAPRIGRGWFHRVSDGAGLAGACTRPAGESTESAEACAKRAEACTRPAEARTRPFGV